MKEFVLDASVILKWYLPDESHGEKALDYLKQYVSGAIGIMAPSLLEYELLNALVVARRRGRLEGDQTVLAMSGFYELGIPLFPMTDLQGRILHFTTLYRRSAYDASYLALAEIKKAPLVTADESLYRSV
ncbi:MAG: type II toxin-antitoxin system VapC family toxin [Smithellaceae bacterium]|nr:type II toxin-antitoxin system VapC family toxin [Smithellaceae bacterium]